MIKRHPIIVGFGLAIIAVILAIRFYPVQADRAVRTIPEITITGSSSNSIHPALAR